MAETPTISLMSTELEAQDVNISASQRMNSQVTKRVRFNNPIEYWLFVRTMLDKGLAGSTGAGEQALSEMSPEDYQRSLKAKANPRTKAAGISAHMPDRSHVTQFPNYVDPQTGDVLDSSFDPGGGRMCVSGYGPGSRYGSLGARRSRGGSPSQPTLS
jgi:hypothetical protein